MRIPQPLLRTAVYALHRKYTAGALVVCRARDGRVLLVDQVHGEARWGFPGGLVGAHETFEACVARELAEETGLTLDSPNRLRLVAVLPQEHARHLDVVFRLDLTEVVEEVASRDRFEVREAAWFAPDTLPPLRRESRDLLRRLPGLLDG